MTYIISQSRAHILDDRDLDGEPARVGPARTAWPRRARWQLNRSVSSSGRGTGAPGDVESPPRTIEVKAYGRSARGTDLWLEVRQVEEARRNPDFYVYVVENVRQGDPAAFTLKVIGGPRLAGLLSRAREQRYFTLPWPVAEYDATGED